jgi:GTP-binding protein of the ras superfamily involved in termination of M-phase
MNAPQDVEMGEHDDSMNDTITQSTVHAHQQQMMQPQDYNLNNIAVNANNVNNGYTSAGAALDSSTSSRPQTSYSDTAFTRSTGTTYVPYSDADNTPPQYRNGGQAAFQQQQQQQQQQKTPSRPPSGMSGTMQQPAYGQQPQEPGKSPSVVIKVGMVGDAQIGKTSLMVKYVEGSWDEDYIQTLGK